MAEKKTTTKTTAKATTDKPKKTGNNNALAQPVTVSGDLEEVIGKGPMTRAQVTSKVWEYIKKYDLQDSADKRQINPDDKLSKVIGKDQISMFKMTAAVSKHLS